MSGGYFYVLMEYDTTVTCLFSLEGALLASLAVCTAASADAASGVALKISHMSCWHSLFPT